MADEKKNENRAPKWAWWLLTTMSVIITLVSATLTYNYLAPKAPAQQQLCWQLCWEKIPGATMHTDTLQKTMPAIIQRAGNSLTIVYKYDGGKGEMTGVSTDGISFDGQWKDGVGWGRFHLRFASACSAVGWVDDKNTKPINLWLVAKETI